MATDDSSFDERVKIILLGDSAVGKTCLLLRCADNSFKRTWVTTIGIDYKFKILDVGGVRVRLEIWDTAGQERFRTITTSYIRGAEGIMLCYDVTNADSFSAIDNWMKEIDKSSGSNRHIQKLLVGNKCDAAAVRFVCARACGGCGRGQRPLRKAAPPCLTRLWYECWHICFPRHDPRATGGAGS